MISLKNYELFVEKSKSKQGNEYCGLFIKIGDKKIFLSFLSDSIYNYIDNLSK